MSAKKYQLGSKIPIPPPVRDWAESVKKTAGVFRTTYHGLPVYVIACGEQPSGGYSIVVNQARGEGDTVLDCYVEAPRPTDFVIQVVTYPYEVVFSKEGPLRFRFRLRGKPEEVEPVAFPPLQE
jgi:hypothetical protein